MAIGSLFVILLLYVSQAFPLRTLGWLIRSLLAYIVHTGWQSRLAEAEITKPIARSARLITQGWCVQIPARKSRD